MLMRVRVKHIHARRLCIPAHRRREIPVSIEHIGCKSSGELVQSQRQGYGLPDPHDPGKLVVLVERLELPERLDNRIISYGLYSRDQHNVH